MLASLKREWRLLRSGKPGSRFQAVYKARAAGGGPKWGWALVGMAVIAAGIIALPLPGPGFLVIGVGVALVARESAVVARTADRIELRVRGKG